MDNTTFKKKERRKKRKSWRNFFTHWHTRRVSGHPTNHPIDKSIHIPREADTHGDTSRNTWYLVDWPLFVYLSMASALSNVNTLNIPDPPDSTVNRTRCLYLEKEIKIRLTITKKWKNSYHIHFVQFDKRYLISDQSIYGENGVNILCDLCDKYNDVI